MFQIQQERQNAKQQKAAKKQQQKEEKQARKLRKLRERLRKKKEEEALREKKEQEKMIKKQQQERKKLKEEQDKMLKKQQQEQEKMLKRQQQEQEKLKQEQEKLKQEQEKLRKRKEKQEQEEMLKKQQEEQKKLRKQKEKQEKNAKMCAVHSKRQCKEDKACDYLDEEDECWPKYLKIRDAERTWAGKKYYGDNYAMNEEQKQYKEYLDVKSKAQTTIAKNWRRRQAQNNLTDRRRSVVDKCFNKDTDVCAEDEDCTVRQKRYKQKKRPICMPHPDRFPRAILSKYKNSGEYIKAYHESRKGKRNKRKEDQDEKCLMSLPDADVCRTPCHFDEKEKICFPEDLPVPEDLTWREYLSGKEKYSSEHKEYMKKYKSIDNQKRRDVDTENFFKEAVRKKEEKDYDTRRRKANAYASTLSEGDRQCFRTYTKPDCDALEQCTYDEKEKVCDAKAVKDKYGYFNWRNYGRENEDQRLYRDNYKRGRQNWMQDNVGFSKKK